MFRPLHRFAATLFAAATFAATTVPSAARAEPPVPLLWKVSDADNSVYLLGSFHLLGEDDYPLSKDVDAAFADAEALMFELSPEEANSPALPLQMAQAARRTRPGSLQQDLGPGLWADLEGYAAANGLPLAQLATFEPWFVGLTVGLIEMGKQGLDPALGLDRHFMDAAARTGKPANGLELASEQIGVLAGMTLDEQRAMGWLDENDRPREGFKTTEQGAATSVWAAVGDELEGVGGLYLEDCNQAVPWSKEAPWVGVMPHALDPEAAERLWALSVETTGAGA